MPSSLIPKMSQQGTSEGASRIRLHHPQRLLLLLLLWFLLSYSFSFIHLLYKCWLIFETHKKRDPHRILDFLPVCHGGLPESFFLLLSRLTACWFWLHWQKAQHGARKVRAEPTMCIAYSTATCRGVAWLLPQLATSCWCTEAGSTK